MCAFVSFTLELILNKFFFNMEKLKLLKSFIVCVCTYACINAFSTFKHLG